MDNSVKKTKIAVVLRYTNCLKLLLPVCYEVKKLNQNVSFYVFCQNIPRGEREASRINSNLAKKLINGFWGECIFHDFSSFQRLPGFLLLNSIYKLVGVELGEDVVGHYSSFKRNNISMYNLKYMADSIWKPVDYSNMFKRIYHTNAFLKNKHIQLYGNDDKKRHKCLGSPLIDCINNKKNGKEVLVFLPNIREYQVDTAFGCKDNYINIIKKISEYKKPICIHRPKHWVPKEIAELAKETICCEGLDTILSKNSGWGMETEVSKILPRSFVSVIFCSTGIFECVKSNNYVINILLPFNLWKWKHEQMDEFFIKSGVYNYNGVSKSYTINQFLEESVVYDAINPESQKEWLDKFVGTRGNSSYLIAKDILLS